MFKGGKVCREMEEVSKKDTPVSHRSPEVRDSWRSSIQCPPRGRPRVPASPWMETRPTPRTPPQSRPWLHPAPARPASRTPRTGPAPCPGAPSSPGSPTARRWRTGAICCSGSGRWTADPGAAGIGRPAGTAVCGTPGRRPGRRCRRDRPGPVGRDPRRSAGAWSPGGGTGKEPWNAAAGGRSWCGGRTESPPRSPWFGTGSS